MQRLVSGIAAVLSVAALTAVLAANADRSQSGPSSIRAPDDGAPQVVNRSTASTVPCSVPMSWNVVRIDPRFGLDVDSAAGAVAAAARAWEQAAGLDLFHRIDADSADVDLPVRFYFDERQERGIEQRRAEEELANLDAGLEEEIARIEGALDSLGTERDEHRTRVEDFEDRLAAFNDTVREWNRSGGAPDSIRDRLSERGRALDVEGSELQENQNSLNDRLARIDEAREAYDRRVDQRNRRAAEIMDAFPATSVESGLYREAVGREGGRVVSVEREVRIYRFGSGEDLVRIAAHELGHALGLGHSEEPEALMNAEFEADDGEPGTPLVADSDVALLRDRCPAL